MKNATPNQKSIEKSIKHRNAYMKWMQGEIEKELKKIGFPKIVQLSKERGLNNYQSR